MGRTQFTNSISANWQRLTMREAIIKFWPTPGAKPEMSELGTLTK
jgi:hypothetical protein